MPKPFIAPMILMLFQASPIHAQSPQDAQAVQNQERAERERRDAERRILLEPRQGERIRRDQVNPVAAPAARVSSRIANRLDTRLRTRLERTADDGRDRVGLSGAVLNDPNRNRGRRR